MARSVAAISLSLSFSMSNWDSEPSVHPQNDPGHLRMQEAAVVSKLRAEKIKLWEEPFVSCDDALEALGAAFGAALGMGMDEVTEILRAAQARAMAKLKKRIITVTANEVAVELDCKMRGAEAKMRLAAALGLPNEVRVVVLGRGLREDTTLEDQGWPTDASRRRPLRALVIPTTTETATTREDPVSTLARAARRVAREVELTDLHGRGDAALESQTNIKSDVVVGLALHSRGRALLDASGGDPIKCAMAVPYLVDADEAFGKVPSDVAAKLDNIGLLQLDICRAYAFVEDPGALEDAKDRLQRAETALLRRLDPRYVDAALRAVQTPSFRKKIPPDLVPLCRLKLLKGVFKAATVCGRNSDLDAARGLLKALTVSLTEAEPLLLMGASRCEAVAVIRKAEGDMDRAAALFLDTKRSDLLRPTFFGRPKQPKRPRVSAQALDQLRQLAPHCDLAAMASALRRSNNDVNAALDTILRPNFPAASNAPSQPPPPAASPGPSDDQDDDDDDDDDEGYHEARELLHRELGGSANGADAAAVDGCSLDLEKLLLARWT